MTSQPEVIPVPTNRRRVVWICALLALIVLVVLTIIALAGGDEKAPVDNSAWCDKAGDIVRIDPATDECIGVSDVPFGYTFSSSYAPMKAVQDAIAAENKAVTEAARTQPASYFVDIAYVVPIPWQNLGVTPLPSVTHQLEGAYARQFLNNQLDQPGHPPRVRLLIANTGYDSHGWQPVADQLKALKATGRLVAVTGFGPSLDTTEQLLTGLAQDGIATLGTLITSDTLHGQIGGVGSVPVRRITPTNQEEIAAALHYMAAMTTGKRMVLVAPGDNADVDSYTKTLIEAFQRQNRTPTDLEFFDPGSPAYNATLDNIASRLCNSTDVNAVYFAGRASAGVHLTGEVGRRCAANRKIKIFAGDTMNDELSTVPTETEDWVTLRNALASGKVELYYTGLAHPDQWGKATGLANAQEMRQLSDRIGKLRHTELYPLDDGDAIMAYDSILILIEAVSQVSAGLTQPSPAIADLQQLNNGFFTITRKSPVCGASGPITLVRDDAEAAGLVGNTVNKPIALARIVVSQPDRTQLRSQFVELYYPRGSREWSGQCGFP
jgi:hypothetical protein